MSDASLTVCTSKEPPINPIQMEKGTTDLDKRVKKVVRFHPECVDNERTLSISAKINLAKSELSTPKYRFRKITNREGTKNYFWALDKNKVFSSFGLKIDYKGLVRIQINFNCLGGIALIEKKLGLRVNTEYVVAPYPGGCSITPYGVTSKRSKEIAIFYRVTHIPQQVM